MKLLYILIATALAIGCAACGNGNGGGEAKEDFTAKTMLQGIWIEEETGLPLLRIENDSIFYADPQNAPATFSVIHDSIHVRYAEREVTYKIERQSDYDFWFRTGNDDEGLVKLYKSEEADDILYFREKEVEVISSTPEVLQKDSVIYYNSIRYRGYVNINPSTMKVTKTSYADNGLAVEQIYYDNVIHICVYTGKKYLFGQNVDKWLFASLFADEELKQMILSDMNFVGVDDGGFHFQAILSIPETQAFHLVNICVNEGRLTFNRA